MEDASYLFLIKNPEGKYNATCLDFNKSDESQSDYDNEDCTIGNEEFLEESSIINGFSKLTDISIEKVKQLLSGEIHISEIPELDYTSVIHDRDRHKVDDYYYYYLQNGIVIFGLDSSHELIQLMNKSNFDDELEVKFDEEVCSNIITHSRAKRRRYKKTMLSNICYIKSKDKTYTITVPKELANLEVIEVNEILKNESSLLLSKEGWIAILLDKNKTILGSKRFNKNRNGYQKQYLFE